MQMRRGQCVLRSRISDLLKRLAGTGSKALTTRNRKVVPIHMEMTVSPKACSLRVHWGKVPNGTPFSAAVDLRDGDPREFARHR